MAIILAGERVVLPCAAAELRHPIVRRSPALGWIPPNIPVSLRVLPRGAAFLKPSMLVRRVVGDKIKNDLQPLGVRRTKQGVKIG